MRLSSASAPFMTILARLHDTSSKRVQFRGMADARGCGRRGSLRGAGLFLDDVPHIIKLQLLNGFTYSFQDRLIVR